MDFKTGAWNPHQNKPNGRAEALQLGEFEFVFGTDTRAQLFNFAGHGMAPWMRGKF